MSVWFQTCYIEEVRKRKGPQAGQVVKEHRQYRTKSLTDMHIHLADKFGVTVCRCDSSVPFSLGVWTEVVYDGVRGRFTPQFNSDGSKRRDGPE